jgi:hypothetical protein
MLVDRIEGVAMEDGKFQKGNFDNFIVVESGSFKGVAKTVFSMQISKAICKIIKYKYNRKELMVLDPNNEKIKDLIKNLPKACPVHIDEAILIGYKRDFGKDPNKDLIKFINLCRKHKKIIIMNIPDFWDLDKGLLNLCDYRITAVVRGQVHVRIKWLCGDSKDKWLRDESIDKQSFIKNAVDYSGEMSRIRSMRNYLFDIKFEDLPDAEYDEYEKDSIEREMISFEFQAMDKWKLRFFIIVLQITRYKLITWEKLTSLLNEGIMKHCRAWKLNPAGQVLTASSLRHIKKNQAPVLYNRECANLYTKELSKGEEEPAAPEKPDDDIGGDF